MNRRPFYTVPDDCYLFKDKLKSNQNSPEETVRQWVLFELLGTYGYRLDQIQLEVSVRYGTKTGFIDILIMYDDKPFIVIECKKNNYRKRSEPLEQAKSYAAAPSINAPYAMFTNGDSWQVVHRGNDGWHPYPDIPRQNSSDEISLHMQDVQHIWELINPVIYWLNKSPRGEDVLLFIRALQPNFNGYVLFNEGTDQYLVSAIDHVLRATEISSEINGYHEGKLSAAFKYLQLYLQSHQLENYVGDTFSYNQHELYTLPVFQLERFKTNQVSVNCELDVLAIQLLLSLYKTSRYIAAQTKEKDLELSAVLMDSLYQYISAALKRNLNIAFPQKENVSFHEVCETSVNDWKRHCDSINSNQGVGGELAGIVSSKLKGIFRSKRI